MSGEGSRKVEGMLRCSAGKTGVDDYPPPFCSDETARQLQHGQGFNLASRSACGVSAKTGVRTVRAGEVAYLWSKTRRSHS